MPESKELEKIKKLYGEKFMHLCRRLFPTILEQEGLLTEVLQQNFATNSRTLGEDITEEIEEEFKNFIFSKVDVEKEKPEIIEKKTPKELLEEAGYDLYECESEDDIQNFKKYYKQGEELCTFHGGRLDRCLVFWAVRKDAEKIKREDFDKPRREDEYGTSVMSIQFSRGENSTVSIKNRYNHTVNNPDATYGNDLDRIIPGLTQSFAELLAQRGIQLNNSNIEGIEIPKYVVANDGKYYKYNMEINGIYYCPGNVIINNGNVMQLESEKQVLIDYFILDKESKTLELYDKGAADSFVKSFKSINTIQMEKDDNIEKGARRLTIQLEGSGTPILVEIDKDNNIIGYINEALQKIGDNFLCENIKLSRLELPRLMKVGDCFLENNENMKKLELPSLKEVGEEFFYSNQEISQLELPNLIETRDDFLYSNRELSQLKLPNLTEVGDCFLCANRKLSQLELPNLIEVGDYFLCNNKELRQLKLPNLRRIGDYYFLKNNQRVTNLYLPKIEGKCYQWVDRLKSVVIQNRLQINKEEIGKLDKDSELTTTEVNQGQAVLEKTTNIEKKEEQK